MLRHGTIRSPRKNGVRWNPRLSRLQLPGVVSSAIRASRPALAPNIACSTGWSRTLRF